MAALLRRLRARAAYRAPRLALSLAAWPFRLLPGSLVQRACFAIFYGASRRAPRVAMRTLLRIDDYLTWCVNDLALRYDGGVHVKHRLMRYHDFFVDRIRPGERVVDLGCGYGAVAFSIASRTDATVVGVDFDATNIAHARQRFSRPNLTFVEGDVLTDLAEESYDVVVLSNVLEHIQHRVQFLREAQKRLTPERWLIRVPMIDRDWRVPLRKELGLPYFSDGTHFTEYTRDEFEEELEAAGLAVTHLQINWGEIWAEARPRR